MFNFNVYVAASEIWPTANNHEDKGYVSGLVRGYNIEVKTWKGQVEWLSCEYIHGEPEQHFNDDFHTWMYEDSGFTPTGRICFRGYGREEWSVEEHEDLIVPCDPEGNDLPRNQW